MLGTAHRTVGSFFASSSFNVKGAGMYLDDEIIRNPLFLDEHPAVIVIALVAEWSGHKEHLVIFCPGFNRHNTDVWSIGCPDFRVN